MAWIASLKEMGKVGVRTSVDKLLRYGMVKPGRQVGSDEFGNKYFENDKEMFGRDRWVEYANKDFDASEIPAVWHSWLHHSSDLTPQSDFAQKEGLFPHYKREHVPNQTGSRLAYNPHNHIRNDRWRPVSGKAQAWQPELETESTSTSTSSSS